MGELRARWERPSEEGVGRWLEDNHDRLQQAGLAWLRATWGATLLEAVRTRLQQAGLSEDTLAGLEVQFVTYPGAFFHHAIGEEGGELIGVELEHLEDPDVESVGALWQGPELLPETARRLAERFLEGWRQRPGPSL